MEAREAKSPIEDEIGWKPVRTGSMKHECCFQRNDNEREFYGVAWGAKNERGGYSSFRLY
jgi:hypothetical protein